MRTTKTSKQTKILVTAGTDDEIVALASELHKIRLSHPDLADKLDFIYYGLVLREHPFIEKYSPAMSITDPREYEEKVSNANIIFCHPRGMHKLRTRYVQNVGVCLVDNASRMVEYESVIPVIFTPKVFLLFGNQKTRPSDYFNMDRLFPDMNMNQSLYKRLYQYKSERHQTILNLNDSFRFDLGIHNFLNSQFYDNKMICHSSHHHDHNNNRYPLVDFRMIHSQDDILVNLLQSMITVVNPRQYKYAIIVPPNGNNKIEPIQWEDRRHFIVSTNVSFNPKECDIMVIWSNTEMFSSQRHSPDELHYAMTKVKHSLFIVGDIAKLKKNDKWKRIYDYSANERKIVTTSLKNLPEDFKHNLISH